MLHSHSQYRPSHLHANLVMLCHHLRYNRAHAVTVPQEPYTVAFRRSTWLDFVSERNAFVGLVAQLMC